MTWALVWTDRGRQQVKTFLLEENARKYAERIGIPQSCVSWMRIADVPRSGPVDTADVARPPQ